MDETLSYIIEFLLGDSFSSEYAGLIGYTSEEAEFSKYKVVIVPSGFFNEDVYGQISSIPKLPFGKIEGIPLLYGKGETEVIGNTIVTKADIIASSYFFISRYEEFVCRTRRDVHGRFPGKESVLFRAGLIDTPLIDMYGAFLRKLLINAGIHICEPSKGLKKVWLTHDVDAPFFCRSLRAVMREAVKGIGLGKALSIYRGNLEDDPYYTFPWIVADDGKLCSKYQDKCKALYFLKVGGKSSFDKPHYDISFPDVRKMVDLLKKSGAVFGLHSSYESGKNPELVIEEQKSISGRWGIGNIKYNRNHFLRSCEPENFRALADAGITDDFTMGYADVSGFRLATSRPVRWIDPETRSITDLVMHPLLVMDCTLSDGKYMGMEMDDAFVYCARLIDKVSRYNGEVVLLWHNTSFVQGKGYEYHSLLYRKLIDYIDGML